VTPYLLSEIVADTSEANLIVKWWWCFGVHFVILA